MADHESTHFDDEAPISSIRDLDRPTLNLVIGILRARFQLAPAEVLLDSRFVEDLGLDIFDMPALVLALEEAFEIDIPSSTAARIVTVRDAVRLCG